LQAENIWNEVNGECTPEEPKTEEPVEPVEPTEPVKKELVKEETPVEIESSSTGIIIACLAVLLFAAVIAVVGVVLYKKRKNRVTMLNKEQTKGDPQSVANTEGVDISSNAPEGPERSNTTDLALDP